MDYKAVLKQLRTENKKTQTEVATYLHIDQRVYSRYECGVNAMPIKYLERLCRYYKVSADYILGLKSTRQIDHYIDAE